MSFCESGFSTLNTKVIIISFRYGGLFKNIAGELKSVTGRSDCIVDWDYFANNSIPLITGKYFQCLGRKYSKVRLIGLAAGNAYDERLPMFAIGKSPNPRCFEGVKSLPCRYRAQRKSRMSSELFEEWVRELNRKFGSIKRKISLIALIIIQLIRMWKMLSELN